MVCSKVKRPTGHPSKTEGMRRPTIPQRSLWVLRKRVPPVRSRSVCVKFPGILQIQVNELGKRACHYLWTKRAHMDNLTVVWRVSIYVDCKGPRPLQIVGKDKITLGVPERRLSR